MPCGARRHILPDDAAIHINKRQGEGKSQAGQQSGQREEALPAQQVQQNDDRQEYAQPDHKDVRVHSEAGETIGGLIEQQALEGRDQDHAHQQQHGNPQPGEAPALRIVLAFDNGAETQEEQQAAEGDRNEFAETAPGIFGISEALQADIGAGAEEILELDDHEEGEQCHHRPQHHGGLGEAQEARHERLAVP